MVVDNRNNDGSSTSLSELKNIVRGRKHVFEEHVRKRLQRKIAEQKTPRYSRAGVSSVSTLKGSNDIYVEGRTDGEADQFFFHDDDNFFRNGSNDGREPEDDERELFNDKVLYSESAMETVDTRGTSNAIHERNFTFTSKEDGGEEIKATDSSAWNTNKPSFSFRSSGLSDINEDKSHSARSQRFFTPASGKKYFIQDDGSVSTSRSHRSSMLSTDANSVSVGSQTSFLRPIARIRVISSDYDSVPVLSMDSGPITKAESKQPTPKTKLKNASSAAKKSLDIGPDTRDEIVESDSRCQTVKVQERSSNFCGCEKSFDKRATSEVTDAGTALISTNRDFNKKDIIQYRTPQENESEDSSIVSGFPNTYGSNSFTSLEGTVSQDSHSLNPLSKDALQTKARKEDLPDSCHAVAGSKSFRSVDSKGRTKTKDPPTSVKDFKVEKGFRRIFQKAKKSMRKSKIGVQNKVLMKMRRFVASLKNAMIRPFMLKKQPAKGDVLVDNGILEAKSTIIDEKLAQELLNERSDHSSSIMIASQYVSTGRDLLSEAAELKATNPKKCQDLTIKAHTYAYVARQMAKKALWCRQSKEQTRGSKSFNDAEHSRHTSRNEIVEESDAAAANENENDNWDKKLRELELFSFEDFFPSWICLSGCGNSAADAEALKVHEALELLAKISEEEVISNKANGTARKRMTSTEQVPGKIQDLTITAFLSEDTGFEDEKEDKDMDDASPDMIKQLVTNLQNFYGMDLGNSFTTAMNRKSFNNPEETILFSHQSSAGTATPRQSNILSDTTETKKEETSQTLFNHSESTFDWAKLRESLFGANDDEGDEGDEDSHDEESHDDKTGEHYYSDISYYTESLKYDDASSYSRSFTTHGTSIGSTSAGGGGGTMKLSRSTMGSNVSRTPSTAAPTPPPAEMPAEEEEDVYAIASIPLEPSPSSKKRRSLWRFGRKAEI